MVYRQTVQRKLQGIMQWCVFFWESFEETYSGIEGDLV